MIYGLLMIWFLDMLLGGGGNCTDKGSADRG